MHLAEALADYAIEYDIKKVKPEAVELAKSFFADGMACMIAGAKEEPTLIAEQYASEFGCKGEATTIVSGLEVDAMSAALVNGIAAHYLDFDDVADSANSHVSVVMLPTALAMGECVGASGQEVLEAYMLGIEVCTLVGRTVGNANFAKGWHSTQSIGIFGAAATAGKLMGLNREQFINAYGIAASEAAGLKSNFGSMTKSFHAGSAASKAIRAVRLASLGFDARPDCIEKKCGYGDLTVGITDFTPTIEAIKAGATEFLDPGMIMKPYPACKATHNGIDAALQLVEEYDLKPEDIDHIQSDVQPYVVDLLRFPNPETKLQGKFSASYTIACAIAYKAVRLCDFEGEEFDPVIAELIPKIEMVARTDMNNGDIMVMRGDTIVHVWTKDGRELECRVNYATGDPHAPMSEAMRHAKWAECLGRTLRDDSVQDIIGVIEAIDDQPSITQVMQRIAEVAR